jgi:hypothetical protein
MNKRKIFSEKLKIIGVKRGKRRKAVPCNVLLARDRNISREIISARAQRKSGAGQKHYTAH